MPGMFRPLLTAVALAIVITVCPSGAAFSAGIRDQGPGRFQMSSEDVSLDDAIRRVREVYGDVTILKAETRRSGDRRIHRIKILTDSGRVKTVNVDARTGEVH